MLRGNRAFRTRYGDVPRILREIRACRACLRGRDDDATRKLLPWNSGSSFQRGRRAVRSFVKPCCRTETRTHESPARNGRSDDEGVRACVHTVISGRNHWRRPEINAAVQLLVARSAGCAAGTINLAVVCVCVCQTSNRSRWP